MPQSQLQPDTGSEPATNPLIFISHKHTDHAIATAIRNFINEQTRGNFRIFQSSDAKAVGPSVAHELNAELQKALWEAKAVILVYTTSDKDWGYCMWECGVATKPGSPPTRIIVFQCAAQIPVVYSGQVFVDARTKEGIAPFVTQFMTAKDFLPGATKAITGYHPESPEVEKAIAKFYADLDAVIPKREVEEWPAYPFIRLEICAAVADAVYKSQSTNAMDANKKRIAQEAQITFVDVAAQRLFGLAGFNGLTLHDLIARWQNALPSASAAWVDALLEQLVKCTQWAFPTLHWTSMPAVSESSEPHAPVVARVKRLPSGSIEFGVYFFPFTLMTAMSVSNRMVKRGDLYFKCLTPGSEDKIKILELLRELDKHAVNRVPFLNDKGQALYLCHRSLLDQFIARRLTSGSLAGLEAVTLADVFAAQPDVKLTISKTFGFVPLSATLAQVQEVMAKIPGCRDVFVTRSGTDDEPVAGLVTDVMLTTTAD